MKWPIFFFFSVLISLEINCKENISNSSIDSKDITNLLFSGYIRACQLKHESGNARGAINNDGTCTSTWMYHGMRFFEKQNGKNSSFEVCLYEPMTNYIYRPVVPDYMLHETTEEQIKILDDCISVLKNVKKTLWSNPEASVAENIQCSGLNEECSRFGCVSRFKCHIN